jgi:integrase
VFIAPSGGMVNLSNFRKRGWKKALTNAKVQYSSFDQCGHTYATLTLAAGAPIEWISRQLGHTKIWFEPPAMHSLSQQAKHSIERFRGRELLDSCAS